MATFLGYLSKCQSCLVVCPEYLFNSCDIGSCSEVQSKVVLHGCAHDGLQKYHHLVISGENFSFMPTTSVTGHNRKYFVEYNRNNESF